MYLNELENKLKVKFPQKFHEIYETGAMEWMTCSGEEFKEKRADFMNDPNAFMFSLTCECEPLMFDEIPGRLEEMNEMLKWRMEDEGEVLKKGYNLIPFGQSGGGNMFCFLYNGTNNEPMVFEYAHDCYDAPTLWGENFDEFLYTMALSAVDWAEDEAIEDDVWTAYLNMLTPKFKNELENHTFDELHEKFEKLSNELDEKALRIKIFENT